MESDYIVVPFTCQPGMIWVSEISKECYYRKNDELLENLNREITMSKFARIISR